MAVFRSPDQTKTVDSSMTDTGRLPCSPRFAFHCPRRGHEPARCLGRRRIQC